MTTYSNERFNAEAAAWDANPDLHRASEGALQAILTRFPDLSRRTADGSVSSSGPDILEIGCGTGLLSLRMAPYARSLVAVDAASGMIDALHQKLKRPENKSFTNLEPVNVLLVNPEDPSLPPARGGAAGRRKFDLILSHLVMHHIPDLQELLHTMHGCLKPGGWIALTDFEDFGPEARKFHPEAKMSGVERHGIPRKWFEGLMRDEGFVDVDVKEGFSMEIDVENYPGEWAHEKPKTNLGTMNFPFLLCCGRKKD